MCKRDMCIGAEIHGGDRKVGEENGWYVLWKCMRLSPNKIN